MERTEKSLVASALALLVVTASAQPRPDFSGRWIAAPEAPPAGAKPAPPGFGSGLGDDITIAQTASSLRIERAQFSQYDIQPTMAFVFALDGSESRNSINMGRGPQETATRAAWQDNALTLTTIYRVQDASGKPMTSEVRQVFTLEGPDTLVVHATRSGPPGGQAATSRQAYKKRSP
jgi:hypothetical protein